MLLNPAVRVVTLWNAPAMIFSPAGMAAMVAGLFHSIKVNKNVPPNTNAAVMPRTNLVWMGNFFQRLFLHTSRITVNPRPPKMISAITVRFTITSPVYPVKD